MTLRELFAWAEESGADFDMPLRIHTFGGIGRSGRDLKSATIGFDWESGSIMLHADQPLEVFRTQKQRLEEHDRSRLEMGLLISRFTNGQTGA